eukprot:9365798-Alexandrium_andersonii.AAC.1
MDASTDGAAVCVGARSWQTGSCAQAVRWEGFAWCCIAVAAMPRWASPAVGSRPRALAQL